MAGSTLTIGEAARRLGVSADTLRYYERRGILPKAARTANGYRRYTTDSLRKICLVRNGLRVGFSLKQIASFLRSKESGRPPCREVRAAAGRLLERMDDQIAAMTAAQTELRALLVEWDRRLASTRPGTAALLLEQPVASQLDCVRRDLHRVSRRDR
jgi:MerR family transcriptional regulator, copper efflux regulator